MKRLWLGIRLASLGLACFAAEAGAATIPVNTTLDGIEAGGTCSLREAVQVANTNEPTGGLGGGSLGCAADSAGADTIVLESGQTYKLTEHSTPDDDNTDGDLDLNSQITIQSSGAALATVDGDSTLFPGPPDTERDRVIDVLPAAGAVILTRLRIQGGLDFAAGGGGGIRNRSALTVVDSEITDNVAGLPTSPAGPFKTGGGIFTGDGSVPASEGSLVLSGTTVAGNLAQESNDADGATGGGIHFQGEGPFTVINSTISGNTAMDFAGAGGLSPSVGGGISTLGAATLTNVTITNNQVIGEGGGGGIVTGISPAAIGGTIVGGNTAPAGPDCGGTLTSTGGNLVFNTSSCTFTPGANDLTGVAPNLGILANYGGPTRTHNLNPGSPAINRGGGCPETDQRGFFRAPVAPCDAGAFELNAPTSLPPAPPPLSAPQAEAGPTGQRAAALKKCRKIKRAKARKKCKRKARLLPL